MRISDWSSDVCSSDLPGGYREMRDSCLWREVVYLQRLFGHDQHRRRTIGDLARIRGGDGAAFRERPYATDSLNRRVPPNAFVCHMTCGVALGIGDRDRQNLTFEGASRSRGCGFAVAGERILVHVFAGEPIFVCNHLSALKLTELGDAVACVHAGRHRVAKACLE